MVAATKKVAGTVARSGLGFSQPAGSDFRFQLSEFRLCVLALVAVRKDSVHDARAGHGPVALTGAAAQRACCEYLTVVHAPVPMQVCTS